MKLKVKCSGWSAGRPVAILNRDTARKLTAHINDRIVIKSYPEIVVAVLDLSSELVSKNQILLSKEIIDQLKLKDKDIVEIEIAKNSGIIQIINKKLVCTPLSEKEIYEIVKSIVKNSITEIETAFFISSIYKCGMSLSEIIFLTKAMYKTGKKLKLNNKYVVDKHCIGGIAGNRTTPIVVSICASQGLIFPKTSSRAITSASGTADTMETICKVDLSLKELKKIIKKTNACLAWGGALGFAPADDKLIKVEKLIHLDPEPNLIASILAKKLSVSSKYILIDIPYGKFAKVENKSRALRLKDKFEKIAKSFNLKIKVVLTDGSQPIGNGIGPVLEIKDIFSVLKGDGPTDLKEKSIYLAGEIFELCGKTKKGKGQKLAREILDSGKALEKFYEIIQAQGANLKKIDSILTFARFSKIIKSHRSARISEINNKKINLLARIAGTPNDKQAGLYLHKHLGDRIKKSEPLITIYAQSKNKLKDAVEFYKSEKIIELR